LAIDIRLLRRVNLHARSGVQLSLLRGFTFFVCPCLLLYAARLQPGDVLEPRAIAFRELLDVGTLVI
jgi:hypothetical protein